MRRRNLLAGGAALATVGTTGLARPAIAQGASAKVLRFVPQADLANPDPIWTTATVATNHGYMVWDTLYGINDALIGQPQMCAGHEVSSDELTWTFTLRDGLKFTDGEPVRGVDCTTSIARWAVKNPFGQQLSAQTDEMKPLDDKRFQIRLKKRFRQMTYALGSQGCFVMPERMAKTPATEQIKEFIGSGPFIFKQDEWASGSKAVYVKNPNYVPRQEKPEYYSGGKVANFERVEWIVQPDPATAAAALQTGEVDWLEFPVLDLLPMLRKSQGCDVVRYDPLGSLAIIAFNHLYPAVRQSRSCCARCCRRSIRRNTSPPGSASSRTSASIRSGSSPATRRWRTTPAWRRSPRSAIWRRRRSWWPRAATRARRS